MKTLKKDNIIVARLDDGEDVFQSLEAVFEKFKLTFGVVISGVGMLRQVKLGYFLGQGKYKKSRYKSCFEITSFTGNLSLNESKEFKAHIHTVLAKKNKKTVGGHLVSAVVHNTLELVILEVKTKSVFRRFNPSTKLEGLEIE